jgi:uncharacterized protein YndB with AHSA1/START domain
MTVRESASAQVAASPEMVFSLVTNPSKLPSWNCAITEVVEAPENHLVCRLPTSTIRMSTDA